MSTTPKVSSAVQSPSKSTRERASTDSSLLTCTASAAERRPCARTCATASTAHRHGGIPLEYHTQYASSAVRQARAWARARRHSARRRAHSPARRQRQRSPPRAPLRSTSCIHALSCRSVTYLVRGARLNTGRTPRCRTSVAQQQAAARERYTGRGARWCAWQPPRDAHPHHIPHKLAAQTPRSKRHTKARCGGNAAGARASAPNSDPKPDGTDPAVMPPSCHRELSITQ